MQPFMCFTFLVIGLTVASAQMTFSDGWGVQKRSKAAEGKNLKRIN
jgi:hypothetical protein